MSDPKSINDLLEMMKDKGIDLGQWGDNDAREIKLPQMKKQAKLLGQIRDIFQGVHDQKVREVQDLQELLLRLEHGGGR